MAAAVCGGVSFSSCEEQKKKKEKEKNHKKRKKKDTTTQRKNKQTNHKRVSFGSVICFLRHSNINSLGHSTRRKKPKWMKTLMSIQHQQQEEHHRVVRHL